VVIERSVDVGQTVAVSLSSPVLFKIAQDLREIQIEANVDEADIGNVKKGNSTSFTVDAYPDEEFTGSVGQVRLSPTELQNVVTYTVIITAMNPDMKLLPGMTANVEIVTGIRQNVLRVANEALRFRLRYAMETESRINDGAASSGGRQGELWIQTDAGGKERRSVRLGLSDDHYTEIIDGDIEAGTEVITRIREKKTDGRKFGSNKQ
jgi:HlyD family secretion protein